MPVRLKPQEEFGLSFWFVRRCCPNINCFRYAQIPCDFRQTISPCEVAPSVVQRHTHVHGSLPSPFQPLQFRQKGPLATAFHTCIKEKGIQKFILDCSPMGVMFLK